jgi:Fe-S oxidoreductase
LKVPLGSVSNRGNPWSGNPEDRMKWAEGTGAKEFTPDMEYLYFTCCTQAYDNRNQKSARALIKVLQATGIDFGLLGEKENCCGDAIRKMGGEELFVRLAENNITAFESKEVKRIITGSPHCYNTFVKEYPELGGEYEVKHYTQFLHEKIMDKSLQLKKEVVKKVTYHDPCYLGRHNGIYEPPREVLRSIPGLELIEMERNRVDSLCCGGGGGGLWNEVEADERFSVLRVQEAFDTGAEVIAAACPYCISMFEDALKTIGKEEEMKVMDISELVLESLVE